MTKELEVPWYDPPRTAALEARYPVLGLTPSRTLRSNQGTRTDVEAS